MAAIAETLNETLRTSAAAIVTAAPGAGKSTLLPLTMLCNFDGKIVVLEPRRVAARQIASRMAWLLGETVGDTVGYRIRFESRVSERTRIEVVTEGVLTRMLLDDPALEGVAVVVFDEFHERSLNSDEAFALTRQCQQLLRGDLRIVVMSATIDTAALVEVLHCPVLESEGRMFPVDLIHSQEEADVQNVSQLTARTILQAHRDHEGDILAFLPGEGEIRRVEEMISGALEGTKIFPLYGLMSNEEQAHAIAPSAKGERKVVLATPIAETSLTIEGVRVVVDSGLCRKMVFDVRSGLSHMETVRISKDMAIQRTGRAGRVAAGVCYRLWSKALESRMDAVRRPEILDADLASLVLDAAIWGEREVEHLPWLTPPPKSALIHARKLLQSLGAIDGEGQVTAHGRALSKLPCHPRIASMLLTADTRERKSLAADIAALLEEKDPLAGNGDIAMSTRLDALRRERRIGNILLESRPLIGDHREAVLRAICDAIVKDGPSMLSFTDELQNMQRRIAFIAARHPELELPSVDNDAVCRSAPEWGPLFVGNATSVAELKKIDLREVVWSRLTYDQQQAVDRMAPIHIAVPTGSRIRLEYRLGAEVPVLRVRLQECFGLTDTPVVDGVPVLMELLSPGFKPVQLTTDLRSFWQTTYFEVRKELRRRYPKHAWPDNPLDAEPVRGVRKHC